ELARVLVGGGVAGHLLHRLRAVAAVAHGLVAALPLRVGLLVDGPPLGASVGVGVGGVLAVALRGQVAVDLDPDLLRLRAAGLGVPAVLLEEAAAVDAGGGVVADRLAEEVGVRHADGVGGGDEVAVGEAALLDGATVVALPHRLVALGQRVGVVLHE